MEYLVSLATTVLMSAEVMLLDALTRLADSLVSTVEAAWSCSTAAPSVPRSDETFEMAAVIAVRAAAAEEVEVRTEELSERGAYICEATEAPMLTVPVLDPSLVKAETVEPNTAVPLKLVELLMLPICFRSA